MHPAYPFPVQVRTRSVLLLGAYLLLYFPAPLFAQKIAADSAKFPKYDLENETKMKGIVQEVKLPPKGSGREAAHLMVKSGDAVLDVYLCPESFLGDLGVTFSKGDEISLTGSKVKHNDVDLILAREVARGSDTLVLRDDKGNPVWGPSR
ncbi:MAG TPA: hypothetical protein VEI01_20885 [Terriglobales bacterium]|nr:hypothetical protein [Terriglobales bacterium]